MRRHVLTGIAALGLTAAALTAQTQINGAGATFPNPIYTKWFSEYNKLHGDVQINYQSVGSGAGIQQMIKRTVFFGATDGPMTGEQLQSAPGKILHFPTVLGAVVPVYNVPGISQELKFSGDVRVSRLYPSPLPDLFKGEQMILVGRYSGQGDSAAVLEGTVQGGSRKFAYDVKFPETCSDNDFIPRLWATRRVGYLLDEIRLHGENAECARTRCNWQALTGLLPARFVESSLRAAGASLSLWMRLDNAPTTQRYQSAS